MSLVSTLIELLTSLIGPLMGQNPTPQVTTRPQGISEPKSKAPTDPWCGWKGLDAPEFWRRIFVIEAAGSDSTDAMDAKARELGLDGLDGYGQVKGTFMEHFGEEAGFMQAMMEARQQEMQGWMDGAASESKLLEPIDGISCETWATVAATLTSMGDAPGAYHKVLAEHGLDAEAYERVQAKWTERMQSAADPMGAAAISQVYGQAFTAARSGGPFTDGANSASASIGSFGVGTEAEEPVSLERYAEIMGAQSAWSKEGRDIHEGLKTAFGLGAIDFSDIGMYWNARIQADYTLAGRLNDLSEHYESQYRTTSAADGDLVL